jgi:hypothetical protein
VILALTKKGEVKMRRRASEIIHDLEIRVARLEKQSARPHLSPRRQVQEGLDEMIEAEAPSFSLPFESSKGGVLKFLKRNTKYTDHHFDQMTKVSVSSDKYQINIEVTRLGLSVHEDLENEREEFHYISTDLITVSFKGKVLRHSFNWEERNLTEREYLKAKRGDVRVDFDWFDQ